MHWYLSYRSDPLVKPLADRHYNRQNPESLNFVPPGKCVVLRTLDCDAFWVTLAPYAEYIRHRWAGAWTCTAFRNEGPFLSSTLITQAVAATLFILKTPPEIGFITFVNAAKIKSANPGCCFKKADWQHVGFTEGGLYAFQLLPSCFPQAIAPLLWTTRVGTSRPEVTHKNEHLGLLWRQSWGNDSGSQIKQSRSNPSAIASNSHLTLTPKKQKISRETWILRHRVHLLTHSGGSTYMRLGSERKFLEKQYSLLRGTGPPDVDMPSIPSLASRFFLGEHGQVASLQIVATPAVRLCGRGDLQACLEPPPRVGLSSAPTPASPRLSHTSVGVSESRANTS
jgi:hypothetical protein